MKTLHRKRDAAYGAAMLTLRTTIALSRAELANYLGVSREAVGGWETGRSYPKAEHLKELIALAVQKQAFTTENAAEEIRVLWKVAHQKEPLDERWLSALLSGRPHLYIVPKPVEETTIVGTVPYARPPTIAQGTPLPRVDWGDAIVLTTFYGREEEQALLFQWVTQEHCRVVSVLGMGGIGKSALAVRTMYRLTVGTAAGPCPFDVVIFRSLRDAPLCEVLLDDCLRGLSPQLLRTVPATLEQRISLLLSHLREERVLIVLDNLECLLSEGDVRGHFLPGFEGYGQLLRRIAEKGHQSCLLLTSREKPAELRPLESRYSSVRSLPLAGLDVTACQHLLEDKGLIGTEIEQEQLTKAYASNPLALMIVAETILDLFGGHISEFLAGGTVLFGSITDLLDEQFARLSALEKTVLCWLAIMREPVTLDEMLAVLVTPLPRAQVLEAIDSLHRRSLIERGKRPGSFTLQSVLLEYVTEVLIADASREIQQGRLDRLIQHGLSQAKASEYVRQTQERLLLSPLLADLQYVCRWGQAPPTLRRADGAEQERGKGLALFPTPTVSVEEQLLSLLDHLREKADFAQGYGPANLIALLRTLRGHLRGLDLSKLSIRGASLQSVEMQDAKLCGSLLQDTTLTEAVSAIRTVAINHDGTLWAAGGMQGKVRIWEEGGQTLQQTWQAHADLVYSLAFSPNGRLLASGSRDGTIKLWDMEKCNHWAYPSSTLLWTGWQNTPVSLAFTPDGSLLASAGLDGIVRLWDPQSGRNLQVLAHPSQVHAVAFSPDGHLLASGGFDGAIRLWKIEMSQPPTYVEWISTQTDWVMSLAFAPDGRTLASGHWNQTVKLWEVASLQLRQTHSEHTDRATYVAWSSNGRILASCNKDKTIRLWDVEQGNYRAVLHGHTAGVNGIVFTPDSKQLLSSSEDSTLRVWDVESCQCVRVITGYAISLQDIGWSPDSTHLACSGTDGLVTIWNLSSGTPLRDLHGHTWTVSGVGWSPDGRFLVSCGWDRLLCLWNPASGDCVQTFEDPSILLLSTAWSPDGSLLACGTYLQGMQVWDMTARRLRWVGQPHLIAFYSVAWSPDGTLLVGSSGDSDGCVYLWQSTDGTLLERLQGHQGRVTAVAWSPDGRFLASGGGRGSSGELFLWDMQTSRDRAPARVPPFGSPHSLSLGVGTEASHPGIVTALAWTPSGDKLVSGGSDGLLRWWDVQSRECISTQAAHQGMIQALKISPDGRQLASCGDDGAIMLWDLESFGQAQGTVPTTPPLLRTLRRDRPYERLNITDIRGLTDAQKATLQALGAIEETTP